MTKPRSMALNNTSGIYPVEFKVLVKPDPTETKTAGGIYFPDDVKERRDMAQGKGVLVAAGGNAFEDWEAAPEPGDRVMYARYAGLEVPEKDSADGKHYRLMNDKDVAAVLR